ncbi:MAG: 16S rRNA (cytosine(1402)-N(4))-methyltransferase, partial [Rivularia sp. (in: cyanobacteria)]
MINQSPTPSDLETTTFLHIPVLADEIITGLGIRSGGHYLDTTVGGGGHSRLILSAPDTKITAIDRDEDALTAAKNNLAEYGSRVEFIHSNFSTYEFTRNTFDGIIADLGVSSYHLDNPERGFSFRHEASLDMRMDRRQSLTAAEAINHWDEVELAN